MAAKISESSSDRLAAVVGLCVGIRQGKGERGTQAASNGSSALLFCFSYISRDRLWVGESIVTSWGGLEGAGRLQWRANSLAMKELNSNER